MNRLLLALVLLSICLAQSAAQTDAPSSSSAPQGTAAAAQTDAPSSSSAPQGTAALESEEKRLCNKGLEGWVTKCPGVEAIGSVSDPEKTPVNQTLLNTVCPCLDEAAMTKYEEELFLVATYCDADTVMGIRLFAEMLCAKNPKTQLYCGTEFTEALKLITMVGEYMGSGALNPQLLNQAYLKTTCTECFDEFLIGAFSIFGDAAAMAVDPTCDENCQKANDKIAEALASLSAASVACIPNDNMDEKDIPFCFPFVYNELKTVGAGCTAKADEAACERTNGECQWFSGKCLGLTEVPISLGGEVQMPPYSLLDKFCKNSCFFMIQFGMISVAETINELYEMVPESRRNKVQKKREHRFLGLAEGKAVSKVSNKQMDSAENQLESIVEFICLDVDTGANKGKKCITQVPPMADSSIDFSACDMASFYTHSPNCSTACAASVKTLIASGGCCYGSVSSMQMMVDPKHEELPNYQGIATACGVTLPASCNPYGSAPQPVTTKVSGNCDWLKANASNLEELKNATAKSLGVSPKALQDFKATDASGKVCTTSKKAKRFRSLQQSANTLSANFNVVSRDDATAKRIATSAASQGTITIPAVQKEAQTVQTKASNAKIAQTAPTAAPKATTKPTTRPATPAPTSNGLSVTVSAAVILLFAVLAL